MWCRLTKSFQCSVIGSQIWRMLWPRIEVTKAKATSTEVAFVVSSLNRANVLVGPPQAQRCRVEERCVGSFNFCDASRNYLGRCQSDAVNPSRFVANIG